MTNKPRLKALREIVFKIVNTTSKKKRYQLNEDFDLLNDDGWQTCAVGSFLNDCGINVKQVARCKNTEPRRIINSLVNDEIVQRGSNFESNVYSKSKVRRQRALTLLDDLIKARPCTILKV